MEVNFNKYCKNPCDYCENQGSKKCQYCIASGGNGTYIRVPTHFKGNTTFEDLYFRLLEDFTHMLFNMGFWITK